MLIQARHRGRRVHSGAPWSLGSVASTLGVVGFIQVSPGGYRVHSC